MARAPIYTVAIGAALTLYIEALTGDPSIVTPTAARLKLIMSPVDAVPPESQASVGSLVIATQTTSPGNDASGVAILPGWYLTLPASVTSTLATGWYMADMAFTISGVPDVTDPVVINIVNAVSLP